MINKIIEKAISQLGYKEGNNNNTKYGIEYGLNYNPWCQMFIWWIAKEVGIGSEIIPKTASCPIAYKWFKDRGQIISGSNAKKGDILFIQWNSSKNADHVGIIEKVEGNTIYTIEGNRDNTVKRCTYNKTSTNIFAVARPSYTNVESEKEEEDEMKVYKNGSTAEPVYADTKLSIKIGELNPQEQCDCFGIFENRAMVRYKVDNQSNYKMGFCNWLDGVK